ncbi:MAG TPA: hypothetical protein ACFYEF_00370 [Candidatus Wunengus sp. YC63]|uniref:hypothetical protein n=1 Tax=unclassified Candidatus Wunengus TaxID=3367695 RepID=UPI0040297AE7
MIISERRLLANRQNSLKAREKCTGPKNFDNTKYNAVKHGMTSLQLVMLPHEDAEEYEKLCESIKNMVPLKDSMDDMLAEKIAFYFWRLRRGAIAEGEIIQSCAKLERIDWQSLLKSGYLGKICRYERRIMNYLGRLLKELGDRLKTQSPH